MYGLILYFHIRELQSCVGLAGAEQAGQASWSLVAPVGCLRIYRRRVALKIRIVIIKLMRIFPVIGFEKKGYLLYKSTDRVVYIQTREVLTDHVDYDTKWEDTMTSGISTDNFKWWSSIDSCEKRGGDPYRLNLKLG